MLKKVKAKVRQGVGKVRRFTLGRSAAYVNKHLARRQGECARCGACCKLLFHCPFLVENADGSTLCRIHQKRPRNCRIFPVNESDLRDRDTLRPDLPCGYSFTPVPAKAKPKQKSVRKKKSA